MNALAATDDPRDPAYWRERGARVLVRALRDGAPCEIEFLYSEGQAARIVAAYVAACVALRLSGDVDGAVLSDAGGTAPPAAARRI